MKTVILANGAFPSHAVPLAALRGAGRVVCCDGAAEKLEAAGFPPPAWIVGDLDSLGEAARERHAGRLVCVAEQESNDLAKAFRFCVSRGWRELLVLGATGLREDHTLANLALLADFAEEARVSMLTDTGMFTPVLASTQFRSFAGQQVSVFAFAPGVAVYAEGLKYPLDGVRFTRWWQAALNEAVGDSFKLVFEGGPLLVFQTYETQ
jgi:thiamine pyrophosphokinase